MTENQAPDPAPAQAMPEKACKFDQSAPDVRLLQEQANAWFLVADTLDDVADWWHDLEGSGMEKAAQAIRKLAAIPAPEGAQLPPLPEPVALGMDFERGWDGERAYGYTEEHMEAYARAALAAPAPQAPVAEVHENGGQKWARLIADLPPGTMLYAQPVQAPAEGDAWRRRAIRWLRDMQTADVKSAYFSNGMFKVDCANLIDALSDPQPKRTAAPHVGETRFEGWLSCHEPDRNANRTLRYSKQDMRDAYWAGYSERGEAQAPAPGAAFFGNVREALVRGLKWAPPEHVACIRQAINDLDAVRAQAPAVGADATVKESLQVAASDKQRLDWLEQNPGVTLEKLRTTPRGGALLYWRIEDREGEYVGGWTDPEEVPTLRAAIDEAMSRSKPPVQGSQP